MTVSGIWLNEQYATFKIKSPWAWSLDCQQTTLDSEPKIYSCSMSLTIIEHHHSEWIGEAHSLSVFCFSVLLSYRGATSGGNGANARGTDFKCMCHGQEYIKHVNRDEQVSSF